MTLYSARTGSTALTSAATKSLWLLNPVSETILIAQIGVSFDSTSVATGVGIEIYRTVTLGSASGVAATMVKVNRVSDTGAATTTGLTVLTTEPTSVEIIADWFVQPFGGSLDMQYPLGREPIAAAAGSRLGMRYTTVAGVTPNCRAYVWVDE